MYCATIQYRRVTPGDFNLQHYLTFHHQTGLRMLKQHRGVVPYRSEVMPAVAELPHQFACTSTLYFRTRDEVDRFMTLFEVEEAREILFGDLPNYSASPPEIQINEVIEFDTETYAFTPKS